MHSKPRQRNALSGFQQSAPQHSASCGSFPISFYNFCRLQQKLSIIQKNLSDSEFGVEDIGKQIGLSRVQLYRKVKAMTGSSVVDLLRKARLAKANRLLESRSMSVSEVAYDVGFSAPSYFTKCFKDEFGMLPGDVGNV